MMDLRPAAIALTLAAAAAAAPSRPATLPEESLTVTMASFRFTPNDLKLVHGRAYALELVNGSRSSHNFVAPQFFAAAGMAQAERARIETSKLELESGERVTIHFVAPPAGRYRFRCSHPLHKPMGMSGLIVVT